MNLPPRPLIALLTDFGLRDAYVAAMKAVLVSICRDAMHVDLGHDIAAQDVAQGARLLVDTVPLLPPDAVLVGVVDPGVGTARRAVAIEAMSGHRLVGPDNGLFAPLVEVLGGVRAMSDIGQSPVRRASAATTFDGRDLFAPVGAHLACGAALAEVGRLRSPTDALVSLAEPQPRREAGRLTGEVVHVDHFGNLVTNIPAGWLSQTGPHALEARLETASGEVRAVVCGLQRSYGSVDPGALLLVVGSTGRLEISVSMGSAAARLELGRGARVTVTLGDDD